MSEILCATFLNHPACVAVTEQIQPGDNYRVLQWWCRQTDRQTEIPGLPEPWAAQALQSLGPCMSFEQNDKL